MSKITVLMPAFNASSTIRASIHSIKNQTYKGWTLIILDDGSTDDTAAICEEYATRDDRIKLVQLAHSGLCATLNSGLRLAQTDYIARLDSDDVAAPERLELQMKFIKKNMNVKVLGTWGERINQKGLRINDLQIGAINNDQYKLLLSQRKPHHLIHSSVIADKNILLAHGGYRQEDFPAEDVYLWTRVAQNYCVMAIPENLTGYRLSGGSISGTRYFEQAIQVARLRYNLKNEVDLDLESFKQIEFHNYLKYINFRRRITGRLAFRRGGESFFNKKLILGGWYLSISLLLTPMYFLERISK